MRIALFSLILMLAAACGDARSEAAGELVRLHSAIEAHAAEYGRIPETLDPARGASPANLPFRTSHGVEVRLQGVAAERYTAVARQGSWLCWSTATRGEPARPDCYPNSNPVQSGAAPPVPLSPP
jgi:hypothetical protein